ncbi:carbohydrate porin [Acidocella aminolytica]|uniref:Carbohydrate-selective porin n=1 Tax=Acidocella aminolytica 101 = DSM 11237 TaxID=1120923 RepID=A0A0D6PFY3_9PROT|nr:carbohydrate porin [Acidocella aminolytica]GAN79764.1 carbohydrate-selective porin [Acidocella aminolytica 101 = DSM 11237]SHF54041.1 porin [Acidocella aminolytica 101 = DSM 11237]
MTKLNLSKKRSILRRTLMAGVAGTGLLASAAHAYTWQDWMNQKTMTGDWNGGRTKLAADGLTFDAGYDGEFADAMSGGKRQGNDYAQQFYYGFKADLGKLAGLDGAVLKVGFNTREGRSTSADYIGNKLSVQEVYGAGETTRISEVSIEQSLFHKMLQLKVGFYPMGNDFGGMAYGCDFQNVGFCAHAQNLPNSSGWSDNPTGHWGGRAKVNFTPSLYLQAGVYDVNPTYGQHGNGLKMSTSGSTGALIPVEAGYKTDFNGLTGEYKVGAYYDTSSAPSVTNSSEMISGRYGFYAIADQMVMGFGGPKRGLIAIAMVSYSDPSTALFQGSVLGAMEARGLFASRPDDYINLGYVRAIINKRALDVKQAESNGTLTNLSTGEGVLEVGYGLQATPWLLIHPNVQYVMDPGTFSYAHVPNAWVFGLETKMKF